MLEHPSGFPRARTLLPETPDPPSESVSAGAGKPDLSFSLPLEPRLAPLHARNRDVGGPRVGDLDHLIDTVTRLDEVELAAIRRFPAQQGRSAPWPDAIGARVRECFARRGVEQPWSHQVEALEQLAAGRDVVLATATASGKSLCFQAPILQAVHDDPSARALFLFPTKALARDQVEALRNLVGREAAWLGAGVYDGDTPPDQRRAARVRAHVIATNPDMLHRAVLPHHDRWSSFLAGLRYVVIDELHSYRGVFGSHVANVLRRLWRVCAFHGARPQIIACSATIANPRELAEHLCARPNFAVVERSGAPIGPRTFVVLNPAVVDPLTGVRRDHLKVTRAVVRELRRAEVSTLAFCRTRKAVELLTRYLREDESGVRERPATRSPAHASREPRGPIDRDAAQRAARAIRGYRGGYLPEHRREIEAALREGEAKVVASTNALELGMDIGGLDAVVLAGYPGTRAATWQRAGRAGRRRDPSLTVMVLSSKPLDQFVAADPDFLFAEPPEHARVDPCNPEILVPHLRCAAYELPFALAREPSGADDAWWSSWGDLPREDLVGALDYLAERRVLLRERDAAGSERYYAIGSAFPADAVDLRGSIEENFTVVEERPSERGPSFEHGKILAEVDFEDAPLYLHIGAIYPLEGRTYEVRRLDWDARKAFVREVEASYYTEAVCKLRVRMLEGAPSEGAQPLGREDPRRVVTGTGYAHVVRAVPGFKKLRFRSHENIGFGPVELPDLEKHTVAAYWSFPDALLALLADPHRRSNAALATAHAIHHVAAMLLMCELGDLRHAVSAGPPSPEGVAAWAPVGSGRSNPEAQLLASGRPTLYLYDDTPGGAGLASRAHALGAALFERAIAVATGCRCRHGCPTCIGTELALPQSPQSASLPSASLQGSVELRPGAGERPVPPEQLARRHARADLLASLHALRDGVGEVGVRWG